jgi:pyrroloquinoline quinone (PQQ) biosynthesis protein C
MARNVKFAVLNSIADQIIAIRDRWHFKNHPFFRTFAEGKLPIKALGRYQALHYHYVSKALPSFGILYARAYHLEDVRKMIAENVAEEEGLKAIPQPGHKPRDHNELIFRFCRAAGRSDDEVRHMKVPAAWLARGLYYHYTTSTEPIGVVLAMQTTQEG